MDRISVQYTQRTENSSGVTTNTQATISGADLDTAIEWVSMLLDGLIETRIARGAEQEETVEDDEASS